MKNRVPLLAVVPLLLLLVATFGAPPQARADDGENHSVAAGIISAVGGSTLPTTITIQDASGPITLNLTASTEIRVDGESDGEVGDDNNQGDSPSRTQHDAGEGGSTITDLTVLVGLFGQAEYDPTTNNVFHLDVESHFKVFGRVSAVGAATAPTTLTLQPFRAPAITVNITATTEIDVDDQPITDLTTLVNTGVEVTYDPTTMNATRVRSSSSDSFLVGTITAIDTTASTVTVKTSQGSVTVQVTATTGIDLDGQPATLANLVVGDQVAIAYDGENDQGDHPSRVGHNQGGDGGGDDGGDGGDNNGGQLPVARFIDAYTPATAGTAGTVTGRVQAVSGSAHTVLVATTGGPRQHSRSGVLKVTSATTILINGHPGTFTAVVPGARISATFVSRNHSWIARKLHVTVPRH